MSRLRRASLALVLLSALLLWRRYSGQRDPLEELADRLTDPNVEPSDFSRPLERLFGGTWSATVAPAPDPEVRSFFLKRTGSRPRGADSGRLLGRASIAHQAVITTGWLSLHPDPPSPVLTTKMHLFAEEISTNLFPLKPGADGRPLFPNPFEFLRRLSYQERYVYEENLPRAWEVPVRPRPDRPFLLSTSPFASDVKRGFYAVAIAAVDAPGRDGLARFEGELARAIGAGARVPTPGPTPTSQSWAAAFRSERPLTPGVVSLEDALARSAGLARDAPSSWPRVAREDGRLVTLMDGPSAGDVSAILRSGPEGFVLRAIIPALSREARLLARLPRMGWETGVDAPRMPGNLVWSGRLGPLSRDPYAGEVHAVDEFAFEWRPLGY